MKTPDNYVFYIFLSYALSSLILLIISLRIWLKYKKTIKEQLYYES